MKIFQVAAVVLLSLVVCPAQQPGVIAAKITLRMLNGKTGKPIGRHDVTNIWLGDAKTFSLLQTNAKGEITIEIGNVQPFEIRVLPGNHLDCRSEGNQTSGRLVRYSLDEIISKGVVSENLCGKTRALLVPGILVIYARPMTFIEGMKV